MSIHTEESDYFGGSIMTEQELKKFCVKALNRVPIAENKQERVKIAKDFADRLFIANYFSKEIRQDFIKKELCLYFGLTSNEVAEIIYDIERKEAQIQDKIHISEFKRALQELPIFGKESFFRCNNILEVKKIIKYIKDNYNFNNQDILKKFIQEDLVKHFELTEEESKKVMSEV